jgi:hypothetical protein
LLIELAKTFSRGLTRDARLAAAAVKREHELRAEVLSERVLAHDCLTAPRSALAPAAKSAAAQASIATPSQHQPASI